MFGFYCAAASFEAFGTAGSMRRRPHFLGEPQVGRGRGLRRRYPPSPAPLSAWSPLARQNQTGEAPRVTVTAVLKCNGLQIRSCYYDVL